MSLLLQFAGSLLILVTYLGLQAGWMQPTSRLYLALNVVASAALGVSAFAYAQWGFLVVEVVWTSVSAFGLWRGVTRRRGRRDRSAQPA